MLSARGLPASLQDFILGFNFYCSWSWHSTCSILYCSSTVHYRTILTFLFNHVVMYPTHLLSQDIQNLLQSASRPGQGLYRALEQWMPMEGAAFVMFGGSLKNRWLKTNMFLSIQMQCHINPYFCIFLHISAYFCIFHAIIEWHCNISSHLWMQAFRVSPRKCA